MKKPRKTFHYEIKNHGTEKDKVNIIRYTLLDGKEHSKKVLFKRISKANADDILFRLERNLPILNLEP